MPPLRQAELLMPNGDGAFVRLLFIEHPPA
jgi:hypothetical protein